MMNKSEAESLKRELASVNAQMFPNNAHVAMEAALSYIEKLEQESAANLQRALVAEKDAERYRFLRVTGCDSWMYEVQGYKVYPSNSFVQTKLHGRGIELDCAIDAVIVKTKPDTSTQEVG